MVSVNIIMLLHVFAIKKIGCKAEAEAFEDHEAEAEARLSKI